MRTTLRLDDDLLADAKRHAADTGRTLTPLVEDALREVLARRSDTKRRKTFELPTYGGSGVQPGVNLDSSAALWDLLDGEKWSSRT